MEEMAEEVGDLVFEALVCTCTCFWYSSDLLHIIYKFCVGFHNWSTCCWEVWELPASPGYILWQIISCCQCAHVSTWNCVALRIIQLSFSMICRHLVARMKYVFEQVMLVDGTRKMRGDIIQKTLKAAEFLIKFIIKSRALYEEWATFVLSCCLLSGFAYFYRGSQGKGSEAFNHSLHNLLLTICSMMKLECKENELIAPRAQAQALQFLPQTFDLFLSVLDTKSLG